MGTSLKRNNLLYGMQNHFYRIRTAWQLSLIPSVERLPDQAVILVNCVPFKMETSLKGKNLPPRGNDFFLLNAVPYGIEIILPHKVISLECYYFHYARE